MICFYTVRLSYSPRYLPRKGTETANTNTLAAALQSRIRHDIYPARGRKLEVELKGQMLDPPFATIFTPQGDGNNIFLDRLFVLHPKFATIFTPQGDGNRKAMYNAFYEEQQIRHDIYPARGRKRKPKETCHQRNRCHSPRYLPRKGTETRFIGLKHIPILFVIRHDIYPARGRKHITSYEYLVVTYSFATIFTPQGDGNGLLEKWSITLLLYSPRYLPRKGTETKEFFRGSDFNLVFATIFTPQGDGNPIAPST